VQSRNAVNAARHSSATVRNGRATNCPDLCT